MTLLIFCIVYKNCICVQECGLLIFLVQYIPAIKIRCRNPNRLTFIIFFAGLKRMSSSALKYASTSYLFDSVFYYQVIEIWCIHFFLIDRGEFWSFVLVCFGVCGCAYLRVLPLEYCPLMTSFWRAILEKFRILIFIEYCPGRAILDKFYLFIFVEYCPRGNTRKN